MGAPLLKPKITVDDYLALERASQDRHIYLDGEAFDMAGESDAHGDITVNLVITLGSQLKGSPCRLRTKDTKVRSGLGPLFGHSVEGMFSYPDIAVICGDRQFHDAHEDIVLNPKAILEVLSSSTEAFDRGEKFVRYRTWNPTLTDYLLVTQDQPRIEHFVKQTDGSWSLRTYTGLEASVSVTSISCTLKLADVYEGVRFGEGE